MKRVELPDFQFFEQKEKLIELLEKEINCADDESLSPEEYELKEQLLETGFRTWTKNDFMRFVSGCEKYGRQNYDRISKKLARDISEV
jgi:SWI/SNF-related matrix-associated actin-dependent regulator of chromatin subfamily A member 5